MSNQDKAYRGYINAHPDESKDEPSVVICGTMWF